MLQIKPATLEHIPEITRIFAHHIQTGTGSFHITPPSLLEMQQKWHELQDRQHPWLVGVENSTQKIVGFCYASDFRKKEAFQFTLEDTIYVHPDHLHQGIGKALLGALINQCKTLGFEQLVAVIGDASNQGSIALHTSQGFTHCGTLKKVGKKHGLTLDIVLMQLELQEV
jgi:phosphinothricin acetyltransferase